MPQKTPRVTYFTVLLYHLTGERAYRGSAGSPVGFLKLITIGRKTGKQRRAHLFYLREGSAYVVSASAGGMKRHPGWFFNLRSQPEATIQAQDTQIQVVAEVAGPEQRKELWARLLSIAPLYASYAKRARREIPMVILRPIEEP